MLCNELFELMKAEAEGFDGVTADCAVSAADDGAIAVAVPVADGCAVVTLYVGE